eukprot:753838-Hanusia_phi.AAC.5
MRLSPRLPRVLQRPPATVLRRVPGAGEVHPWGAVGEEARRVEAGEEGAVDVAHARGPMGLDELAREGGGVGAVRDCARLHQPWPGLVESDGDSVLVSDALVLLEPTDYVVHALLALVQDALDCHRHCLRLPARPQLFAVNVPGSRQQVSLCPCLVELQHYRGRPRTDRPRAEDTDDAGRVLTKLLLPDAPDLPAPERVVPPACLVRVRAQPQRQPSRLAVGARLVPAGPHLVAVLHVDFHILAQRLPHQPRHLPHVVVAGGVGDAEPGE